MHVEQEWQTQPVAVLMSGGLDSAVLAGELARASQRVFPVYVQFGLIWEASEERGLRRYLRALAAPSVESLKVFQIPLGAVYGSHWSATGLGTPNSQTSDDAVFLPGRTLMLFSQVAIWCHLQHIPTIAIGTLAGNPFADSTAEFLEACQRLVNTSLGGSLRFVAPYRQLKKPDILRRGSDFPLAETMSCLRPQGDLHCGECNKCGERQKAFAAAGIPDPTSYAPKLAQFTECGQAAGK